MRTLEIEFEKAENPGLNKLQPYARAIEVKKVSIPQTLQPLYPTLFPSCRKLVGF